jgi:hypothetical protein
MIWRAAAASLTLRTSVLWTVTDLNIHYHSTPECTLFFHVFMLLISWLRPVDALGLQLTGCACGLVAWLFWFEVALQWIDHQLGCCRCRRNRRVRGRWCPNVMAVISDAFHLKQRVTEAFGIVRSKFIGPLAFGRVLSVRICFVLAAD